MLNCEFVVFYSFASITFFGRFLLGIIFIYHFISGDARATRLQTLVSSIKHFWMHYILIPSFLLYLLRQCPHPSCGSLYRSARSCSWFIRWKFGATHTHTSIIISWHRRPPYCKVIIRLDFGNDNYRTEAGRHGLNRLSHDVAAYRCHRHYWSCVIAIKSRLRTPSEKFGIGFNIYTW